jgi:hypothetical protein
MKFSQCETPQLREVLKALITTLSMKIDKGTRLIAVPNGKKIRDAFAFANKIGNPQRNPKPCV